MFPPGPVHWRVQNSISNLKAVDDLLYGIHGVGFGKLFDRGRIVAREMEFQVERGAALTVPDLNAWPAQPLHGLKQYDHSGPFGASLHPVGASLPSPDADRCSFGRPLSGQRPRHSRRDSADRFSPFGGLWGAVFGALDVFFPPVEAVGMSGHVLFVIGTFGKPCVGNRGSYGAVRARAVADPFIAKTPGCEGANRVDADCFDSQFLEPHAPDLAVLPAITPGRFGIIGPEHHEFAMTHHILQQVRVVPGGHRLLETPGVDSTQNHPSQLSGFPIT